MQQLRLADSSHRRRWWRRSHTRTSRGEGAAADVPPSSFGVVSPVRADPQPGATAEVVGRMLRGLAERAQVLCVTHLPQVAAQGHQQITIAKAASDGATRVTAQSLTHDQRRDELARMLGGVDVTEKTRELAEQMLAQSAA